MPRIEETDRQTDRQTDSSKELGFLNPRSKLNSTVVTYWPMQLKNSIILNSP